MFFWIRASRLAQPAVVMIASLAICHAAPQAIENRLLPQEPTNAPAGQRTDWRKTFRTEFNYRPAAQPAPLAQPEVTAETPESPADPDVVVLPKYVVREDARDHRELEKIIRSTNPGTNQVAKKLGIGRHEVRFRRFSLGSETIFFIPISGGISW